MPREEVSDFQRRKAWAATGAGLAGTAGGAYLGGRYTAKLSRDVGNRMRAGGVTPGKKAFRSLARSPGKTLKTYGRALGGGIKAKPGRALLAGVGTAASLTAPPMATGGIYRLTSSKSNPHSRHDYAPMSEHVTHSVKESLHGRAEPVRAVAGGSAEERKARKINYTAGWVGGTAGTALGGALGARIPKHRIVGGAVGSTLGGIAGGVGAMHAANRKIQRMTHGRYKVGTYEVERVKKFDQGNKPLTQGEVQGLRHRKRIQSHISQTSGALGLGALGALSAGHLAPKLIPVKHAAKWAPRAAKLKAAAAPISVVGGGVGAAGSFNFARIQGQESRQVKKALYDQNVDSFPSLQEEFSKAFGIKLRRPAMRRSFVAQRRNPMGQVKSYAVRGSYA